MLYTSCFRKWKKVPNPVSIALTSPKYYTGKSYSALAPTRYILSRFKRNLIDEKQYAKEYFDMLCFRELTQEKVIEDLPNIFTLLCWETEEKFCHRHLVSEWLRTCGFKIREF